MKRLVLAATLLAATLTAATAAPPTGQQMDLFARTCLKNGGTAPVCDCKADIAPRLVDSVFMAVVLESMQGKALDPKNAPAYWSYLSKSNAACVESY